MDCGPACLKMIAKFYGKELPLYQLRQKTNITREGVSLLGISEAAQNIGFRTRAVKLSLDDLTRGAMLPSILHWNQNHFVVLHKVKRNKLFVADPGRGLLKYKTKDLKRCWGVDESSGNVEGFALLLETTPAFYSIDAATGSSGRLHIKGVFRYIQPYRKLFFQLLLGFGIAGLLQLILPFLTKSIVDVGIAASNLNFIYIVLLAQLSLFASLLAVDFIRNWLLLHISARVNVAILSDFLIKLMRLPISFFESRRVGDILQRINDHQRIESFLTGTCLTALFSSANLLIFSVVLAIFNLKIFLIFFTASTLYTIWVVLFLKKKAEIDHSRFDIAAREQSATIQLVQGMQEIKLNGAERSLRWNWEKLQVSLFKVTMKGLKLTQWQQLGAFFLNEGKKIFITFLSAKLVIDGKITLGTMLAIQYIIGQLNSPIEQMIGFLQSWQNAKISMDRLNEVHTLENEEPAHKRLLRHLPSRTEEGAIGRSISLRNVSFTYPGAGNEPALKDISIFIPKGKITAIVGASGSGKTTLLKLLLKFHAPQKGEIHLGDIPLESISHRYWRKHCGVVMQDSYVFSDTIANNIAVGQTEIDTDSLNQAVHISNCGDFIEQLPLGVHTVIGGAGAGISMGQKQRILIARAVYKNPEYVFLDEATNSLDTDNENVIVRKLNGYLAGRTVLVIAHRLSTVKNADQIIVMKQGRVYEQGTHEELIDLKGEYYALVRNQLELSR